MSTHSLKEKGSKELTFLEHFEELRVRLLISVIALAITTLVSFAFAQYLLRFIAIPIGGLEKLQSIEVTENISVFMRVSLLSGVLLAMPVIVYQLLRFILPGLTTKEKRWVMNCSPIRFSTVCWRGYFRILRHASTGHPILNHFPGCSNSTKVIQLHELRHQYHVLDRH